MARTLTGQVIDFAAERQARAAADGPDAVDLVAAWSRRREQLLGEAELLTREIAAHAERLSEAAEAFGALNRSAVRALGEIHAQVEMIDTAIVTWTALTAGAGGGSGEG